MAMQIEKADILGVGISTSDMSAILRQIERWITTREQHYVCLCSNHGIMMSQKDDDLRKVLNVAGIAAPDGVSVVLACRLQGYGMVRQVRGTDLMLQVCKRAAEKGYSNFLYGGADGIPQKLAENLTQRFPGFNVRGTYSPPFRALTEQERSDVIHMINLADPDILWVGLGAPKQELWMARFAEHLNVPVMVGTGAAFDFLSGSKQEAPKWVQRAGIEWLFRLAREPRRLWKRNLYHPIFIGEVLLQKWFH